MLRSTCLLLIVGGFFLAWQAEAQSQFPLDNWDAYAKKFETFECTGEWDGRSGKYQTACKAKFRWACDEDKFVFDVEILSSSGYENLPPYDRLYTIGHGAQAQQKVFGPQLSRPKIITYPEVSLACAEFPNSLIRPHQGGENFLSKELPKRIVECGTLPKGQYRHPESGLLVDYELDPTVTYCKQTSVHDFEDRAKYSRWEYKFKQNAEGQLVPVELSRKRVHPPHTDEITVKFDHFTFGKPKDKFTVEEFP